MNITRICTLYFSATGNTAHVVNLLAETMAKQMNIPGLQIFLLQVLQIVKRITALQKMMWLS